MSSRSYERTHPWVNFTLDLRRVPHQLWMLLGEARSKCEHLAGVPLRPEEAEGLYEVYLTKGVHATTSIEGNTLSEEEVLERVRGKLKLPTSREYLGREVDNIVKACREIMRNVLKQPNSSLDSGRIRHFNATVLNGRTARLIEYQLLVQSGMVPFPAGHLLSNHYNKTRTRYYRELDQTSKSGGEVVPFLLYAIEGFVDGLREQLAYIREKQYRDMWVNYVHDLFRDDDTPAHRRQKHLVLEMPIGPVGRAEIPQISPRVAAEFATRGEKTLTRDLDALVRRGLLRRVGRSTIANREIILAFLPPKVAPEG